MNISFCTVSMNRLHHLQQTLVANMQNNICDKEGINIEFVLLDYNSVDGLEQWIESSLDYYIQAGILKFYRTTEPEHFDRSHSRNMAFRLATGDIVCNVDADNYIGPKFYQFLIDFFTTNGNAFLTPSFGQRDVIGKLCMRRDAFLLQKGYNESMDGYGFEDLELYSRFIKAGIEHHMIYDEKFLQAIRHSHEERYKNESLSKNIDAIYIRQQSPYKSELLFVFKNLTYARGFVINNQLMRLHQTSKEYAFEESKTEGRFSGFLDEQSVIILQDEWETGHWSLLDRVLVLHGPDNSALHTICLDNNSLKATNKKQNFKRILNEELKASIILLKTELSNRKILNNALNSQLPIIVNKIGFGQGCVKVNLTQNTIHIS